MTYSIVAVDKETGELGVAVQSHYFQVGPVVPWALAGVGAVATQSMVNVSFGPMGIEYMRAGYSAPQALKALLAADNEPQSRQVALVDASGNVAAHTGSRCIPAAGHRIGDGFSCQANLMEKDTVWDAMFEAYKASDAPLAERMLAALEAAEGEGGDIRGKQSAAMLVVSGKPTGRSWEDRLIDLRVEDAPDPVVELRRLLRIKRAYMASNDAERLADDGDQAGAAERLRDALALAPEMVEIHFWGGLGMAMAGMVDAGCELMARAVEKDRRWIETVNRLVAAERLPADLAKEARKADRDDGDQKEPAVVMDAVVSQALPNAMFEVEVEGGHKLIAYAAGRMRRYFIRITPGDRIRVELSPYDLTRGRIVYRYRD